MSRDGAIFSWRFTPRPKGVPAKAPVATAAAAAASEDAANDATAVDEEDEPVQDPSDFPFLAREYGRYCSQLLC